MAIGSVRGSVAYRERIAMPAGAEVTVTVADTSRADAPERVIGRQVIADPGNVPVPFDVAYDPAEVSERLTYTIRATITVDGALRWTTDTVTPVITRGAPTEVHLVVRRTGT